MNNEVKDILEKAYKQGRLDGCVTRDKFTLLNEEKEDI